MFDLFRNRLKDVKGIRNSLLQFIKEQLQKAEGGEGENIKGVYVYVTCADAEKYLYEAALYTEDSERFKKEEVQKIADDFAISLPLTWTMEISFVDIPPPEAIKATDVDAALFISTRTKPAVHKQATASIKILVGEAEKEMYTITSSFPGKINIGRERKVQTADGFYRENFIAFTDSVSNKANKSVSRQHAHIEWDMENASFFLYADEGGIPPLNKMKVRTPDGNIEKIQTKEIGRRLRDGDQIMIGESAILEFSYNSPENSAING